VPGATGLAIPVMDSGAGGVLQRPLPAGKYWLAVRAAGEKPGRWPLRFDHVPVRCVPTGNELVPTPQVQLLGPTTCQQGDEFNPSCAARPASDLDVSYVVMKCPNLVATFTTCASKTVADTVLSAIQGSVAYDLDKGCGLAGDAKEVACDAGDPNSKVCPRPGSASVAVENAVSGILTVNVDNQPIVGAAACGAFELDYCAGKGCLPLSR
jgi:hypothetical protein